MAEKNGLDLELQAVENIPRDTLVALLRRKDKELKAQQLKIEKLEERYVKVVRFNKILTEDRQSFQRFCHELLPECDGAFEEAAAQETAADLQELLRQLAEWRRHGNAAHEDRKVFQQFLDLIFPNDEAIAGLFARPSMGEGAFDLLQTKWMKLEDLHNQSISSINAMAHDQALAQQEDLYAAQRAQLEAEKKIQALQDELAGMAREKAQVLKQKLDGKSTGSGDAEQVASISKDPREQRALEEEKAAAERREREAWQSLDRQREAMQASIDELRAEARRLRLDLERERCEAELHRCEAEKRLEDKENALSQMRLKTGELEQELTSTDSITRLAEQQALREVEMKKHQQKVQQANQSLLEVQKMLEMSYAQEKVLKDRIRELESSQGRSHMSGTASSNCELPRISSLML